MEFINDSDRFDQHFLCDENVINKFIVSSDLNENDIVVEIGPGKGNVSEKIVKKVKKLYCIELDKRLEPYLSALAMKNKNVEIIYGNALDVFIPDCDKIITSLPYSIIEPFMYKMIKCKFENLIMITGNKFAQNVAEKKVTRLSLLTNCFFNSYIIDTIPPTCFKPQPRVMSAMIKLSHAYEENLEYEFLFFRYMFLLNHKKIKNALIESFIKFDKKFGNELTQRESKKIVESLNLNCELLETKFEVCSNEQLEIIFDVVKELLYDTHRHSISSKKNI